MATYNEKAWAFVRKTKTPFTAWDLARIAQVSKDFARKYLLFLEKAGYIKQTGKIKTGRRGKYSKVFRTIKITGIKPVRINIKRNLLIDENTKQIIKMRD